MKTKSLKIDPRLYDAAAARLDEAGWNNIDFAVECFLAECVVRKRLPAFLNHNTHVKLRYRIEREGGRDADLMMFNTPEAARRFLETR